MMFRFTLLTCSMAVCIMFLNMVKTSERKIKYAKSDELDGMSCLAADVTVDEVSRSPISCLTKCTEKGCGTMFYNNETRMCTGCATWYTSNNGLPTSAGTIAYRSPGVYVDSQCISDEYCVLTAPERVECASGEGSYGTSCYSVLGAMSWHNAKAECASVANRYLAVPDSMEEMQAITSWLNTVRPNFGLANIGITEEGTLGTWKNIHGEPQIFFNWNDNEPSGGSENCAAMYSSSKWNDVGCTSTYIAVCEKNMIAK